MKRFLLRQWYKVTDYPLLFTHAAAGMFRVKYESGELGQRMGYRIAKDYATIIGGRVIDAF